MCPFSSGRILQLKNNGCSWYFDVPVKQMIMKKDVNVITVIFFTTVVFNKQ